MNLPEEERFMKLVLSLNAGPDSDRPSSSSLRNGSEITGIPRTDCLEAVQKKPFCYETSPPTQLRCLGLIGTFFW